MSTAAASSASANDNDRDAIASASASARAIALRESAKEDIAAYLEELAADLGVRRMRHLVERQDATWGGADMPSDEAAAAVADAVKTRLHAARHLLAARLLPDVDTAIAAIAENGHLPSPLRMRHLAETAGNFEHAMRRASRAVHAAHDLLEAEKEEEEEEEATTTTTTTTTATEQAEQPEPEDGDR